MAKPYHAIMLLLFLLVAMATKGQGEHALARGKNTLGVLGLISSLTLESN